MGRVVTDETRRKISDANKGQVVLPRRSEYQRQMMKDRVFTEEHRENLSANWNRTEVTCPHCGLACHPPQYGRWHGDRCKKRPRPRKGKSLYGHNSAHKDRVASGIRT